MAVGAPLGKFLIERFNALNLYCCAQIVEAFATFVGFQLCYMLRKDLLHMGVALAIGDMFFGRVCGAVKDMGEPVIRAWISDQDQIERFNAGGGQKKSMYA